MAPPSSCVPMSATCAWMIEISFGGEAGAKGIEWVCVNPRTGRLRGRHGRVAAGRFRRHHRSGAHPGGDPDAAPWLAPKGVMNIFAGVARGVSARIDLSDAYLRDTRIIGHSASTIDDLRLMLHQAESGELSPNRSVAAIGSLSAAKDGLLSPCVTRFTPAKSSSTLKSRTSPSIAVPDLKDVLPTVYALLIDNREWTNEAEAEFLRLMLP